MPPSVQRATRWRIRGRVLPVAGRTLVMGILNVTPDSFSDGGRFLAPEEAVAQALRLVQEGADIVDVGGESTRPGSDPVPEHEELRRVVPVIRALATRTDAPLSVDTRKAEVARQALAAGVSIVNDVSALGDPQMAERVHRAEAGLVLMHMQGDPKTMQAAPNYRDVVGEVAEFLGEKAKRAITAGLPADAIAIDPGFGFGKRTGHGIEDNAALLKHLDRLIELGHPVVVGASRKAFIGNLLHAPMGERLEGSLAAAALAAWQGAHVVRVHDVKATRRVVDLVDAVRAP